MDGDRRDDWRHGVDENLASLNAGQRVWEHEQKTLRKALAEIDALLRGDTGRETDGFIARLHTLETAINLLRAVIDVDKAGNKGLVGRVEALESGERTSGARWKFWTAIVGFILAATTAVLTNLDKLQAWANRGRPDPVEQMVDDARHPKPRHHHYTVKPTEPEQEEPAP